MVASSLGEEGEEEKSKGSLAELISKLGCSFYSKIKKISVSDYLLSPNQYSVCINHLKDYLLLPSKSCACINHLSPEYINQKSSYVKSIEPKIQPNELGGI